MSYYVVQGRCLRRAVTCVETAAYRGAKHHSWAGGVFLDHAGYMLETVDTSDPMAMHGLRWWWPPPGRRRSIG